jgi:hypothetical protein
LHPYNKAVANYAACMFSLPKGWMMEAGFNRQCAEVGLYKLNSVYA